MKTLSQILNSSHGTHLTESASTKILTTTLYALGFKEAKGSDMRSFKGVPKEEILNLYGIPMRAGKWADVWFAILEDDVYIVVNNNNVYEYGEVSDAIKGIQKIGVKQKKLVGEAVMSKEISKIKNEFDMELIPQSKWAKTYSTNVRKVKQLYGIPQGNGEYDDVYFVIYDDENKPYGVVNIEGTSQYAKFSDAIARLKFALNSMSEALQEVYRPMRKRVIRAMDMIADFDGEEYEELLFSLAYEASRNSMDFDNDDLKDVSDILFKAAKTWKAFRPPVLNKSAQDAKNTITA